MAHKKLVSVLVLTSLLATLAFGQAVVLSLQGDVNGDGSIDVLDAQLLVAKVVKGGSSSPLGNADANSDGQVNILDLQYTLARVGGAPVEEAPVPSDSKSPVGTLNPALVLVAALAAIAIGLYNALVQPKAKASRQRFLRVLPSQTRRYLLILTPHAPPSFS